MDSLTIQVSQSTRRVLRELSDATGEAMTDIVDRAVREYQRRRFWPAYHAAYAAIEADPIASVDLRSEAELWDTTSADGLEKDVNDTDAAGELVPG